MKNNILNSQYDHHNYFLRQIRSFVCRQSRITTSQLNAIKNYWSFFGINFKPTPLNFYSIFNNYYPVILEIGFGTGHSLVDTAICYPKINFLGVEVYKPGIGSCLKYSFSSGIKNIKIIYYDVIEVLDKMIINHSLYSIHIFFPDPWPKKRHHKRRMIQKSFLLLILNKIKIGGILHIATDSQSYAYEILNIIHDIPAYKNLSRTHDFIKRPITRPITKFEKKGYLLGHKIFDLMFKIELS